MTTRRRHEKRVAAYLRLHEDSRALTMVHEVGHLLEQVAPGVAGARKGSRIGHRGDIRRMRAVMGQSVGRPPMRCCRGAAGRDAPRGVVGASVCAIHGVA